MKFLKLGTILREEVEEIWPPKSTESVMNRLLGMSLHLNDHSYYRFFVSGANISHG